MSVRQIVKPMKPNSTSRAQAFTLIELLVVIAIIGILAGLVISLAGTATASRQKALVQSQLVNLETVIQSYKDKKGFYPPAASSEPPVLQNPGVNPLFYELSGVAFLAPKYQTVSGGDQIDASVVSTVFKVDGFVNVVPVNNFGNITAALQENPVYRHDFKREQFADHPAVPGVKLLICPVPINPWQYVSNNPTNNPDGFDLWADVTIRGKVYRFNNWSKDPTVLSAP